VFPPLDPCQTIGASVVMLDQHKALARAPWRPAREAQPIPAALLDRLWVDAFVGGLDRVAAGCGRMFRRSETLYRLLLDQQRWPRS